MQLDSPEHKKKKKTRPLTAEEKILKKKTQGKFKLFCYNNVF